MNFSAMDSLNNLTTKKTPTEEEFIMYLFFDKGIDYNTFSKLPIPYIISMAQTYAYIKDLEVKAMNKSKRKGVL